MPKYESWMSHKRVEGTGPMDARIVLVGEAPGVSEVQYGRLLLVRQGSDSLGVEVRRAGRWRRGSIARNSASKMCASTARPIVSPTCGTATPG